MDRGVKIALAALVFLVGTSFAFLYRRPLPDSSLDKPSEASRLVLRGPRWNGPQATYKSRSTFSGAKTEFPSVKPTKAPNSHDGSDVSTLGCASPPLKATVLSPIDTGQPPPPLARVFPRHENSDESRWGAAIGLRLPMGEKRPTLGPRVHRVVDGDTLEDLAARFLGDATRAGEIFGANRRLLSDPNVLPLGVELTIPPQQSFSITPSSPSGPEGFLPDKPVVPVVP